MAASGSSAEARLAQAEHAILELCSRYDNGLTEAALETDLPALDLADKANAINALLSKRRLQIFKQGDALVYKEVKADEAVKFRGLGSEEMLVYQLIQQSGNMGLWTKDLKTRSNLQQPQINKILKVLESRKLIKAVKSVASSNRKVYMLFELEPSREITGGAWYTEHEYDSEFIDVLRQQCLKFILSKGQATLDQMCDFVLATGLSKVDLGVDEVLQIVNTLVYDGKVDAHESRREQGGPYPDGTVYYTPAALAIPEHSALTSVPCGVCPVFNECHEGGVISPQTCVYYAEWLQF